MKNLNFFSFLAIAAIVGIMASCINQPILPPGPGNGGGDDDSITVTPPAGGVGTGTEADPYNVASGIANQGKAAYVKGYIIGSYNFDNDPKFVVGAENAANSSLIIADSPDHTDTYDGIMTVQLPIGAVRTALNLVDNAANLKQEVLLYGNLIAYCGVEGVKETSYAKIGDTEVGAKPGEGGGTDTEGYGTESAPLNVTQYLAKTIAAKDQGTEKTWIEGYIVGSYNFNASEKFAIGTEGAAETSILISDDADIANGNGAVVSVQLPSGLLREKLNLVANPGNYKKKVKLYGLSEAYCGINGVVDTERAFIDGAEIKPEALEGLFAETILTQESFDKFTVVSLVDDARKWTFDAKYGSKMSGYDDANKKSVANIDWFITPAINLAGKSDVVLTFDHARGPASNVNVGVDKGFYTVFISNDYVEGDPTKATWVELTGIVQPTAGWKYVSSGEVAIPAANLKADSRIGFRYECSDAESATWEIKNIVVE